MIIILLFTDGLCLRFFDWRMRLRQRKILDILMNVQLTGGEMKQDLKSQGKEKILETSIPLFAETGFDGVSMRNVAENTGLTPAALYYHFPGKDQLYFEVVVFAFRKITKIVADAIASASTPSAQLESVVDVASRMLAEDRNILRLMQWIMLDRDEERLRRFGAAAFQDLYLAVYKLASELAPQFNPSALAVSIIGVVIFPFEAHAVFQFLPGYDNLETSRLHFLKHVVTLLSDGFAGAPQATPAPATSNAEEGRRDFANYAIDEA